MTTSEPLLPAVGSVRWHVWKYLNEHRGLLETPVLEVGSLAPEHAWWRQLRQQLGFDKGEWLGVDLRAGFNVDVEFDMTKSLRSAPTILAPKFFGSCVCAEVLEHVYFPDAMFDNIWRLLQPGGWALFTVPFCFPFHEHPNDYYRYTPACLSRKLWEADFREIEILEINPVPITLKDHDEKEVLRSAPMHLGAKARKPA
jgi:hypothetical protein